MNKRTEETQDGLKKDEVDILKRMVEGLKDSLYIKTDIEKKEKKAARRLLNYLTGFKLTYENGSDFNMSFNILEYGAIKGLSMICKCTERGAVILKDSFLVQRSEKDLLFEMKYPEEEWIWDLRYNWVK